MEMNHISKSIFIQFYVKPTKFDTDSFFSLTPSLMIVFLIVFVVNAILRPELKIKTAALPLNVARVIRIAMVCAFVMIFGPASLPSFVATGKCPPNTNSEMVEIQSA